MTTQSFKKIRGMEVVISVEDRERILNAMKQILDSGYLMWGDWQEKLVARFCGMTNKDHGVTFNSCTSALEVLFSFLRREFAPVGDRLAVCMQANVFPSPAFAATRAGLDLAWSDIDPVLLCPGTPELDEAYVRQPFDVLLIQWTGGFVPQSVPEIVKWCYDHGVYLVEDASHSAGSKQENSYAGSFGRAAVFSLAATKPLQTGQGGLLLTDNDDLAKYAFQMKNYGRTEMFQRGVFVESGWNLHMTELQAAVGVVLLDAMEDAIARRWELLRQMLKQIPAEPGVSPLVLLGDGSPIGRPNLYKVVAELPVSVEKGPIREALAEQQIELGSSVYDFVTPHLEVFQEKYRNIAFPQCQRYAERHVCLPLHNGLTDDDARRVGRALADVLG